MAPTDKAGRVAFVGNIPYGLSEEQVVDLLGQCGQVLNFRLVYDKDTGRPKGFGFAEFSDADAAASAVRNLNGYETMGRTLRVDYSNEAGSGDNAPSTSNAQQQQHLQQQQLSQQQHFQQFQQLSQQQQSLTSLQSSDGPQGVTLPESVSAPDAISRTLSAMEPAKLLDVISQLKELANSDPGRVQQMLTDKPQVAYAVFQALLLMGLVDTSVLASVVEPSQTPKAQYLQQPTPIPFQTKQHPQAFQAPALPPAFPPAFGHPMSHAVSTPPAHHQAYPPPAMTQSVPTKPPNLSEQQWSTIVQLCRMTQTQVDAIASPSEKSTVMGIRQQYMHWIMPSFTGNSGY